LIDRLQISLTQFFQWTKNEESVGEYLTAGVNDMSLANGGLFDICSDWETAHSSHRDGIDVDIDSRVFVLGANESFNLRDQEYSFILEKLVDLMEQNRLFWKRSEGFHFRFE
jgi:murein endopeptidase